MRLTKLILFILLLPGCGATPEAPQEARPATAPAVPKPPSQVNEQERVLNPVQQGILKGLESLDTSLIGEQAQLLKRLHREAQQEGVAELAARTSYLLGNRLASQGRFEAALEVYGQVRAFARDNQDVHHEAAALNGVGQILGPRQHRWEEALAVFQQGLGVYGDDLQTARQSPGEGILIAIIMGNVGMCHGRLGDFDLGEKRLLEAIDIQQQINNLSDLNIRLGELGNIYFLKGDYAQAAERYKESLDLEIDPTWANNLAITLTQLDDWQEAEQFHRLAQERGITDQPGSQAYWSWAGGRIAVAKGALDEAERLYRQALRQAEGNPSVQWSAHADLGRLLAAYDWSRSRQHFEQAIALIDEAQQALEEEQNQLLFFSRLIRFFQDYVEVLLERGDSEEALRIVESSRARILTGKLELAELNLPPAIDYRSLAQPGRAYLSYWLAPQASYLWLVSQKEVKLFELPPKDEIEQRIGGYSEKGGWDLEAGSWLYDKLLSPVAAKLSEMDRIVVIPDGDLHFLNFETLPLPAASAPRPRYFIEEATVSVAPSLYSGNGSARPLSAHHNALLLVGNPVRPGDPPLPLAEEEMKAISEIFNGWRQQTLQQDEATPKAFLALEAKDKFRLIHIASHAVDNPSNPLQSYISLSPGEDGVSRLFAKDLLSSLSEPLLQAELVTLSACGTAGGRVLGGEGLVGLSWAFLMAGARNVVATLWEAGDKAAFEIMKDFYRRIRAGEPYEKALRQAKLRLVRLEKGNLHKPEYWGPFQLHSR